MGKDHIRDSRPVGSGSKGPNPVGGLEGESNEEVLKRVKALLLYFSHVLTITFHMTHAAHRLPHAEVLVLLDIGTMKV